MDSSEPFGRLTLKAFLPSLDGLHICSSVFTLIPIDVLGLVN